MFICTLTLKWEDRTTAPTISQSQARSKKMAKRKALAQMIDSLICQGFIARGFKEDNFVDKLPRRRKNQSDQSDD